MVKLPVPVGRKAMSFERIFGAAAAILFAAACASGAGAQTDAAGSAAPDGGVIHLHMPGAQTPAPVPPSGSDGAIHLHPIRPHAVRPDTAPDSVTQSLPAAQEASAPETAPAGPVPAKPVHRGSGPATTTIPFNFGEDAPPADGGTVPGAPMPGTPVPTLKTASLPPHGAAPSHAPLAGNAHMGLTKRGAVMFEKGATNPSPVQFDGVKVLAGDLSAALESGASRIQLEAYGGAPGDKSSDARRLSLKRALAVRQLLIDNGVPSNRIDVRAMGGVDDKGPADRVDVFLRAG
jgi:hypothetical protein